MTTWVREAGIEAVVMEPQPEGAPLVFGCAQRAEAGAVATPAGRGDKRCIDFSICHPAIACGADSLNLIDGVPVGPHRPIRLSIAHARLTPSATAGLTVAFGANFTGRALWPRLAKPKPTLFLPAKRVLTYLVGTKSFGRILGEQPSSDFNAFVDASFANDQIDRKSMGGICCVSW